MKRFLILLLAVSVLSIGCVVISVFPFYEPGDLVSAKPLVGRWVPADAAAGSQAAFVFREWTPPGCWFESIEEDGKTNLVGEAHLFKLGDTQFLDLAVAKSDGAEQLARPHLLLKLSQLEPSLKWVMLDYSWLEELLKREPARLRHRFQRDQDGKVDGWVLTAETRELRQFVLSNADNAKAWGEVQEWRRAKP